MPFQPREVRTIQSAAVVSAAAIVLAFGVLPAVRRVVTREALIAARREEITRLRALIRDEPTLRRQVAERVASAKSAPRRVLSARNASLAAAELQASLRGLAELAPLSISSLDVSGEPDSTSSNVLPATLSALGDVQAVSEFLAALRRGPFIMNVTELRIRPNSALRGEPLQISLSVRAPWVEGDSLGPPVAGRRDVDPEGARMAALVVTSNIFSESRRPPSVRYDAGGGVRATPQPGDSTAAPRPSPASGGGFSPQLFGVLGGANGAEALLRLDPRVPGARVYRVGDEGGGYRVVRIAADDVVVDGPGGRRTVHLANPRSERNLP